MNSVKNSLAQIGVRPPEIFLPQRGVNMQKWAVVACDQFTSQREYWENVKTYIGQEPSALNLVLPEVYLEDPDIQQRIKNIQTSMENYLKEKIIFPEKPGFVFVDRQTSHAKSRKGLLIAVDLEKYDYQKGSKSLIRATEGTIIERLPPRIRIREAAPLELPHIMILIDDPDKTVIEPIAAKVNTLPKLYDFDLMMDSGHITGYRVDDPELLNTLTQNLLKLAVPASFQKKYGVKEPVLLFAVGDGNHSLATAKAVWENTKKDAGGLEYATDHPARFALVELVNIYDEGLVFEPIHRVLFNAEMETVLAELKSYHDYSLETFPARQQMQARLKELHQEGKYHNIGFITKDKCGILVIKNPFAQLPVGTLQAFLDAFMAKHRAVKIDYIHGDDVVSGLVSQDAGIGFYLPVIDKRDLFKTVILEGALPRKTFSMGEADEKRFYIESRKIK